MQEPIAVTPDRLQAALAPDSKRKLSVSDEPLAQGLKHAQEHALAAMESAVTKQAGLVVVNPPTEGEALRGRVETYPLGKPLSQAEADRIRAATGADALLRFGITDYGLTPKSWRNGYITFEVTTTLALAGVIAYSAIPGAKAAAGAYLAQETAEETAESYAGFWALDVVCRPVRLEAELVSLTRPVGTVWRSSDTGLAKVKLSRLTRHVGVLERERQLDQATDHAAKDVVSELSVALGKIKPMSEQNRGSAGT